MVGHKGYTLLFKNYEQFCEKCHDMHFRLGQVGQTSVAIVHEGISFAQTRECYEESIKVHPILISRGRGTGGGGGSVIAKTVAMATVVYFTYGACQSFISYFTY
jgi:hypothetical protein